MLPQFKYLQNHYLVRPTQVLCCLFLGAALFPTDSAAFDKPIASKITGADSPHILKANNFSLNARNVKTLKSQGNLLWVGTSMGVIRYDTTADEDLVVYDNRSGLLSNGIFSIEIGPEKKIWVGTYGGGLSHLDGTRWANLNTPNGLNDAFVYDLEFDNDTMWIATWSGANRVRGNPLSKSSWESFTVENTDEGLIDNWVYAIEIGADGRIWFGTEAGLSLFDGVGWQNWNHEDGLGAAHEIVRKENRHVTDKLKGAHHAQQASDLPNTKANGYRPNYIVSMLLDQANRLWMGTWGGGLSLFDTQTQTFRNFTAQDGLPGNYILALKEGPDGNLWIGSSKGLTRFDGKTFLNYSRINGLTSDFIFSIEFSANHFLWVGGHHSVAQFKINPLSGELARLD